MKDVPALTTLKCFEAAARLGSVTQAARELHVTHSAVSQQIGNLEQTMGVALFVREARGLRLTEEGRLYALEIRAALQGIANATRQAQGRGDDNELVITTLASFANHWLMPRLDDFQRLYPHYSVHLHTGLELHNLQRNRADIGIRMGHGHWPEINQKKLFDDELLVVAAPQVAEGRQLDDPESILAGPLLHSTDAPWQDWCRQIGRGDYPLHPARLIANDSNLIIQAALQGRGIALERRSLVAGLLRSGALLQLSPVSVPYPYAYWVVWQQREGLSEKQRHFIEWLTAQVKVYLTP